MNTHRTCVLLAALLLPAPALLTGCEKPNSMLRQESMMAIERGEYDVADTKLSKAVGRNGSDWKAAMLLGEVRLEQDRPLDAQLLFEQALAIRDSDRETDRILNDLAESLYQQNRFENLQTMLAHNATERGHVSDYLLQAKYLAKMGDPDGARLAFRKAARFARPDDASPYLAMADYYESIHDDKHAIESLQRALAILPNNPRIADRLRAYGIVPGPTVSLPPEHIGELPPE